jgi:hypothetical protein
MMSEVIWFLGNAVLLTALEVVPVSESTKLSNLLI